MTRLIQVGFGPAGRTWHRRVTGEFPEVRYAACVDADAAVRARPDVESGSAEHRWFASLEEALEKAEADAVLVATPLESHAPLVKQALLAGRHVIVEKPFTRTVAEAVELAQIAERSGLQLVVGQNYRFFPAVRTVQSLLASGRLGAVGSVSIDFSHNVGLSRTADDKHARLEHPLLIDMAVHHLDLLRMLLQNEPAEIYCRTFNPPWSAYRDPPAAFATMVFPDDIAVSYRGNWLSHDTVTSWSGIWQIECEGGSIVWSGRVSEGDVSADSVAIRRHDGEVESVPLVALPHVDRLGAFDAFLRAIEDDHDAECSGRDNVGTIAFMNAMIESSRTGGPVTVQTTPGTTR